MRGEEKRSWWEHGRAGAHFPWETACRALPRDAPRAEGSPADSFPGGAGSRRGEGRDGNRPAPRLAPGRRKCTLRPLVKPPSLPAREENASHLGKAEARPAALPAPGAGQGGAAGTGQGSGQGSPAPAGTAVRGQPLAGGRARGGRGGGGAGRGTGKL